MRAARARKTRLSRADSAARSALGDMRAVATSTAPPGAPPATTSTASRRAVAARYARRRARAAAPSSAPARCTSARRGDALTDAFSGRCKNETRGVSD